MRQCDGDPEHLVNVVLQLCNQRGKGVALTYCILLQIEDQIEESMSAAAAEMMAPLLREVRGEIKAQEDIDANRRRERLYFGQGVCRTLPKPLAKMILEFVAPTEEEVRRLPTRFTYTETFVDENGRPWLWAPYTCEAWWKDEVDAQCVA
jgi:hypothetical protein